MADPKNKTYLQNGANVIAGTQSRVNAILGDEPAATEPTKAEPDGANRTTQEPAQRPTSWRDYVPGLGPSDEQKKFDDAKAAAKAAEEEAARKQKQEDFEALKKYHAEQRAKGQPAKTASVDLDDQEDGNKNRTPELPGADAKGLSGDKTLLAEATGQPLPEQPDFQEAGNKLTTKAPALTA